MEKETKKRIIKKHIFIAFLLIAIAVCILLMVRYNVEGEQNMPFTLSKIIVKSSISAENNESENLWDLTLEQNNDIYIYIEQNTEIESSETLESIKIDRIIANPKIGKVKLFLPTSNNIKTLFSEESEDYLNTGIEFLSNTSDNLETHEICANGGMIAFRLSTQEIGEYISNEDDEIKYNSSLLEKAEINEEDLSYELEMDITITTSDDIKYKGTANIKLPANSFENSGVVDTEITDLSNVIFKRSE